MNALTQATSSLDELLVARVRGGLEARVRALAAEGLPPLGLEGQLIRPLVALASADPGDERVWLGALAVQYAHEASLVHDDVIDGALRRRGAPTVAAARGVAAALVTGDHLLTTAYRLAAGTGSIEFAELFAHAVERTVAGERRQGEAVGRVLGRGEYLEVVTGKSGELLGAAFAAAPLLAGDVRAERFREAGRRVGVCYQLVDDLLDYCPAVDTGKSALSDLRRQIWTWPLFYLPGFDWSGDPEALPAALATRHAGETPLEAALDGLREVFVQTAAEVRALLPGDRVVGALLCDWLERAEAGVRLALESAPVSAGRALPAPLLPRADLPVLPADTELAGFFARNSRSFSFAARLFPEAERRRVADVYAFCRVSDDIADAPGLSAAHRAARLDAWLELCRRGYTGEATGVAVLDRVLRDAARGGVPFRYIEELVAGMRMDLSPRRYESLAELRVYTHRVASVVGLWLTRLWGVHDECVLERAADLGHAMQLTNIMRDVGEDWEAGRVYLPRDLMARHHVDEATIAALAAGGPVPARWRALHTELVAMADAYYERALEAVPSLPRPVRAAVVVAAAVYRGIHDEIRRNGFDNVTRRARTTRVRKLWLAARAYRRSRREYPARPTTGRKVLRSATAALLLTLALAVAAAAQQAPGMMASDPVARLVDVETRLVLAPADSLLQLERLRLLYHLAVEDERALPEAEAALAAVRAASPQFAERRHAVLGAYQGALRLLRAKHGSWPPSRIGHARAGLRLLDRAVNAAPRDVEVRYVRLASGYHLPGIFRRGAQVREDFATLAALLPHAAGDTAPEVLRDATRFVLAFGVLDPGVRATLERWHSDRG